MTETIILAVAVGGLALIATVLGACVYGASKELSKLTTDIVRAWTDD